MASDPGIDPGDAAILASGAAVTNLSRTAQGMLSSLWLGLPDYRDPQAFVPRAVQIVNAAIDHASRVTAIGLQRNAAANNVDLNVPDPMGYPRTGVDAETVYTRPFSDVYYALSKGTPIDQAVQQADATLQTRVATDIQLAKTKTARSMLSSSRKVIGYQRVPEGTHTCGLCLVAATKFYKKSDLMPIHPNCDCDVDPVYAGTPHPGGILNLPMLQSVHAAVADAFGADSPSAREVPGLLASNSTPQQRNPVMYRDLLIQHEHGEIGPVIAVRKDASLTAALAH